ncbi:MAG: acyltransferase [Burkholderiales bacterium]
MTGESVGKRSTAAMGASPESGRVEEIDTAKGIGIVLVVWGHMVGPDLRPSGNEWWGTWNHYLYAFHMAFFFFLSGYVFFLRPADQWRMRVRKSAIKLVPAYLMFAMLVFLAKAVAVRALHVDRPVQDPLDEVLRMLLYPVYGFAQYLWFIYSLLQVYVIVALLKNWLPRHFGLALIAAAVLHLLAVSGYVTQLFALQQTARYLIFFLLADACLRYPGAWKKLTTRYGGVALVAFASALVTLPVAWLATVAGLLCIPALVALASRLNRLPGPRRLLQYLGRNTLTIYLMNALALGLVRAIFIKAWGWDDWHFFVVAPVLLCSGLALPIVAQRVIFRRWTWLDRITR